MRLVGKVFDKSVHALKTIAVKRFQDAQGGKKESAGAAGGIKHRHRRDRLPEGAQQFQPFGVDNGVAGKLPDIQIQRNQVVNLVDFAPLQFLAHFQAAVAAANVFTPGFRNQSYRVMGLRLLAGIDLEAFRQRFAVDARDIYARELQKLSQAGLVEIKDGCLRLTEKGLPLANEVFVAFV